MNTHDDKDNATSSDPGRPEESLTLLQMIGSTLAAAFGVQSSRNRERDFNRGKPVHFIIIGVVFTTVFVLAVIGVVRLVLSNVG